MTTKREAPARRGDRRRRPDRLEGGNRTTVRRPDDAKPSRRDRPRGKAASSPGRDPRAPRSGPQTTTASRSTVRPAPAKSTKQAKARAVARKAKAPKVVRAPLRERLILRLASVDLRPRTLAAKVPFVVLIIGALAIGLAITLWLSTDAAERSYQLGAIRAQNKALLQEKEALERDVLQAQSAPALAEAARELGMIPTRDTAHLVQDPIGNWVVIGSPKPAEGAPPPPLNVKLPEEQPARPPAPAAQPVEVPVRVSPGSGLPGMPGIPAMPAMPAMPGIPGVPGLNTEVPPAIPAPMPPAGAQYLPGAGSISPIGTDAPPPGLAPVGIPPAPAAAPPASSEQFSPTPITVLLDGVR